MSDRVRVTGAGLAVVSGVEEPHPHGGSRIQSDPTNTWTYSGQTPALSGIVA